MSLLAKLKGCARRLKREIVVLYFAVRHPETPVFAKLIGIAVVAYAVSPIDLIPDFIPIVGFLDDLVLVPLGIAFALKLVPAPVLTECREQARTLIARTKSLGRVAAVVIVLVWLALLILAMRLANRFY